MSFRYIAKKVTVKAYRAKGGGWSWRIMDFFGEHISNSARPLKTKDLALAEGHLDKARYLKETQEKIAARKAKTIPPLTYHQ